MNRILSALLLSCLTALPAFADSQFTVQIEASQDATLIDDPEGARANGAGPYFFVGRTGDGTGGGIRRGLIHFDLEGIPGDARIEDVALHLYASNDPDIQQKVRLYPALKDWGEGASCANGGKGTTAKDDDATWIHTFFDTVFWSVAGGDWDRPASARTTVDMLGSYTWSSNRMKKDVQSWVEQPEKNFGWLLIGNESKLRTVVAFASRESITCGASGLPTELPKPRLEVTYMVD